MSTAIAAPPAPETVDARLHQIRHVYPVAPWLSASILTTPGLIRYYRLQETSGASAADAVGGSAGTYTGGFVLAQGALWTPDDQTIYSVDLNGSTGYVTVPTIDFASACRSFSVEVVFRPDSVAPTQQYLFDARSSDVAGGHVVLSIGNGVVGTNLRASDFGTNVDSATGLIAAATTYHAVVTYDAATDACVIYLNGVQVGSGNTFPYTGVATPTVNIGRYAGGGTYFDGRISDVAIYSRALTAAEVLAHAEAAGLASTSSSNGGLVSRSSTLVLGRPYRGFTIQETNQPGSAGLAQGTYTHRLNDAGEFSLTFPNAAGPDGIPHKDRFDTAGHLEWVELYRDDVLEFVGSVQRVSVDRQSVTVSGPDAMGLLRKAYEIDREWTAAPADVVDTYTRVPVPVLVDEFTDGSLQPWSLRNGNNTTASVSSATGRLTLSSSGAGFGAAYIDLPAFGGVGISEFSDVQFVISSFAGAGSSTWEVGFQTRGQDPGGVRTNYLYVGWSTAGNIVQSVHEFPGGGGGSIGQITGPPVYPATVEIRRRGRLAYTFVNGQLLSVAALGVTANPGRIYIYASWSAGGESLVVDSVRVRDYLPFLRRGATYHDRGLPGDYPVGGLRGRYWSDTDVQGDSGKFNNNLFLPTKAPRNERLDAQVITSLTPFPVSGSNDYFSVRWFGAVYLRGDLGQYRFRFTSLVGGARLWVANTDWGDQIIDDWTVAGSRTSPEGTVLAATIGSRATWVPIVAEFHDTTNVGALNLQFISDGGGYTDPGGTAITGSTWTTIPSTSLSPLGCLDNRVQGASHFDLVKQAAETFALSLWCEPKQLESGEFPGALLAKRRYGRDTDVILQGEDVTPEEPLIGPAVETDAADLATTVRGGGAGIADGRGGQVTAEIFDAAGATASLFDLTAFADAADTNIRDLLIARLDAELALRSSPWQNVSGTPRAQERLADTFPLSATYSAMRWRPGDAVRLWLPEVGVADATPRQIIQVTRDFQPDGRTATSVGFRQRPKGVGRAVRGALRAALAPQRSYQRQLVTLTSAQLNSVAIAAGGYSTFVVMNVMPYEKIVKAKFSITVNSAAQALGIEINFVNRETSLGGPWTLFPTEVDFTPFASPASATDARIYLRVRNTGGVSTNVDFQFFVDVLR